MNRDKEEINERAGSLDEDRVGGRAVLTGSVYGV